MKKIVLIFSLIFLLEAEVGVIHGQTPTGPASQTLHIGGNVQNPLTLTVADLMKMPRKTLSVVNPHSQKKEVYVGVPLEEILRKAGVPNGKHLGGSAMATVVAAEAADGYVVLFSLAELDSGILDSDVIVADTLDGAPLPEKEGPFKIVAPHDKRPARWIRMLKAINVVRVVNQVDR